MTFRTVRNRTAHLGEAVSTSRTASREGNESLPLNHPSGTVDPVIRSNRVRRIVEWSQRHERFLSARPRPVKHAVENPERRPIQQAERKHSGDADIGAGRDWLCVSRRSGSAL